MDERTFCEQVLSQLRRVTPGEREKIRRELQEHLEDHAEALRAAGCSETEAAERAVAAMGDPGEIGRELNRRYPMGWLLVSRAALVLTVLLAISALLYLPVLSNVANSLYARLDPIGAPHFYTALTPEEFDTVWEPNVRVRVGSDIVRIYQMGVRGKAGEAGAVSVAMCNYDRWIGGYASQSLLGDMKITAPSGAEAPSGGGGGNSGAYYFVEENIPITAEDDVLLLTCDSFGTHIRLELPLHREETP